MATKPATKPKAKRKLTAQQTQGTRGAKDTISISSLTHDELKLILLFLYQYDVATDYDNKPHLVRNAKANNPPNEYASANFSRLRYKIEHAVYPKRID